jgi:hypothetical protein
VTDKPAEKNERKPRSYRLGLRAFAAISAVEGLKLSSSSRARLEALRATDLTPEQRRAEILKAYKSRPSK